MSYESDYDGISPARIARNFLILCALFLFIGGGACATFGTIAQNNARELTQVRADHLQDRVDEVPTPETKLLVIMREYCNLPLEARDWDTEDNPFIPKAEELWAEYWTDDLNLIAPPPSTFIETVRTDEVGCPEYHL